MKKSLKSLVALSLAGLVLGSASLGYVSAQESESSEAASSESVESSASSESTESTKGEETEGSELQQAVAAAVEAFEAEYADAEINEIDVELNRDGSYEIDVDGFDDTTDYEITYRSDNAEVTSRETESEDDNQDEQALDLEAVITIDEATEIALSEASLETATSWNLDHVDDNDVPEWQVSFDEDENGGQEAEVTINANDGTVIETELDD